MTKIDSFFHFLHAFLAFCTILALGLEVVLTASSGSDHLTRFIAIGMMLLLSTPKKSLS